jgi:hypothetical protein
VKIFRQKLLFFLVSLMLSLTIIGMIPKSRLRHFRTSCSASHVGVAAMQRFTCDVSSAGQLMVNASKYDLRVLGYVVAVADLRNAQRPHLLEIAAIPLPRLTKRLKLAPSRTDSQDPLV